MELFKEGFFMNKKVMKVITILLMVAALAFAVISPVMAKEISPSEFDNYTHLGVMF